MYVRLNVIVEEMRVQCKHFADWLAKLENLGQ